MRARLALSGLMSSILLLSGQLALAAEEEKEELVSDRPDFVESSKVVGRGVVQLETSVAFERNESNGVRERTSTTPTLLRVGISDSVELRFETDGRTVARTDVLAAGTHSTERGYADTAIGVKWHAMDPVGSLPSLGFLLHFDTASGSAAFRGNGVRPSLRMAAEWDLPGDLSLGVMPGVMFDKEANGERFTSGIFAVALDREWNKQVHTFVELAVPQMASNEHGGNQATFDVGGTYLVAKDLQLDIGFFRGLNKNTPSLSWTVGLTAKF
jgi:hypothetical protein